MVRIFCWSGPKESSFGWPLRFSQWPVPNEVSYQLLKLSCFKWQWDEVTLRLIGFLRIVDGR